MNEITNNPSVPTQKVAEVKFPKFIANLGIIPTSYKDSMSYYECLAWLCKFLEETVIPTINQNGEAVEELQALYIELNSYVTNYFNNLDVQEEINNKLDEMAEEGTLDEIIAEYIKLKGQLVYNSVAEMKIATNLYNGSFAKTYGFRSYNDGGGALYKVRNITNNDVVDEMTIIALSDNNLIAELIIENETINLKQIGAYGDGEHDDTNYLKKAISKANIVYLPFSTYLITDEILIESSKTIKGSDVTSQGYGTTIITEYVGNLFKVTYKNCNFINLYIENVRENIDNSQIGINLTNEIAQSNTLLSNVFIKKFYIGLNNYRFYDITIANCRFANCEYGVRIIEGTTSTKLDKCWALNCVYGYYINRTNYSEINNCYSDSCTNPYYIDDCIGLTLISCGAEVSINTPIQITHGNITIIGFNSYRNNSSGSNNADFIFMSGNNENVKLAVLNVIGCDMRNSNTSSTATKSIVCNYSTLNGFGNTLRKDISIDDNTIINFSYNTDGGQIYRNNIVNRYNYGSVLTSSGTATSAVFNGTITVNKYSPLAEIKINGTLATAISENTQIGTIPSEARPHSSITGYAEINGYPCALYVNTSGSVYLRNVGDTIPTSTQLIGSFIYFGY